MGTSTWLFLILFVEHNAGVSLISITQTLTRQLKKLCKDSEHLKK